MNQLPPPTPPPPKIQHEAAQAVDESTTDRATVNNIIPASNHIFAILGGSNDERQSKKQKKEHEKRVNHIGVQGAHVKTRWSHIRLKQYPHNDVMVISGNVSGFLIHDVLIDNGSSADIIFAKAFDQMKINRNLLETATNPLCGFRGRIVSTLGKITLPVSFGSLDNPRIEHITFDVVEMGYPYNAIFVRGTLNAFEAIVHSGYLCIKMPGPSGVITVHGSQEDARRAERNITPGNKNIHSIEKS